VKVLWISALVPALLLAGSTVSSTGNNTDPVHSRNVLAGSLNVMRTKIVESNNVTLRPGSVYDTSSYYEVLLGVPQPGFNYEFLDAGLGAAEPVYPMFEKGHQGSYAQLIPAFINPSASLHIDNYAGAETVEGCRVDSAYLSRMLSEYPDTAFRKERDEGYNIFLIRLDYYTRTRPDAKCGRHRANDPDPNFDPAKFIEKYHDSKYLSDFPQAELARFEAKTGALRQVRRTTFPLQARVDLNKLTDKSNSLWYYPEGHDFDFGIAKPRPQEGMSDFKLPRHMVVEAASETNAAFPLGSMLKDGFTWRISRTRLATSPTPRTSSSSP